jgi:transcriptional antiterminator NusG
MHGLSKQLHAPHLPVAASAQHSHWYALQTLPRHEKVVASRLQVRGITTFLPLVNEVRQWSDRRKLIQLPLFSTYVFVYVHQSVELRARALSVDGVLNFIGARSGGTPIPDQQIADIEKLLTTNVPCLNHPFLKVGQRVRIRGGVLDGIEGILLKIDGNNTLVVSVELIQRSIAIRVAGYDVETI